MPDISDSGPYSSDSCPDFSALASLVVLQLKKLKRIGELLPKLPPQLPPPLSRKRFKDQITLLWKEKQAARCPSFFWFFSSVAIQPVVFLEGMFAGSLRFDLNKDPLKEWVARAVEASATTDEEINSRKDAQAV